MPIRSFIYLRPPGVIFFKFIALSIFDRLSTGLAILLRNYICLHADSQSTSNSKKNNGHKRHFSEKWGFRQRLGHFAQTELLHNKRFFISRLRNFNPFHYIMSDDVKRAVFTNMGFRPTLRLLCSNSAQH